MYDFKGMECLHFDGHQSLVLTMQEFKSMIFKVMIKGGVAIIS